MKKLRNFLILFVIIVIAINIYQSIQKKDVDGETLYSNADVYNFLDDKWNRTNVNATATKLNNGSSANTCVYFIAEVLRKNNFNVPNETNNISQILTFLKAKGWEKQSNYEELKLGDICFTTDGDGDKNGVPTHTYIFMKWVEEGNYDYAYICDNQAKDYKGKVYHIRNIKVVDKANGYSKDAFAFYMKKI
ncbi:hypothetical protein [Clostridium vincentii]|uniref:Bacteriophage peptidoglycan hydrolase n=1 Tax=Clostridium vincentii TaxID=52704 RepID=A0A2T0BIN9_9CLOT|nr:hypothetical protein [Clostridium vincentii]PRR83703.1 hypothetical protein CLVI_06500 [Clostridium vincentii]